MSNQEGSNFDNQLILYFLIVTAIFYSGCYFVLNYLGYTFADVPSNGNVLTPIITSLFNLISSALNYLVSFNVSFFGFGSLTPFSFLSGIASGLTDIINVLISFVNVWNILNIYIFYIIFVPYCFITILIIFDLAVRLIEGLIP